MTQLSIASEEAVISTWSEIANYRSIGFVKRPTTQQIIIFVNSLVSLEIITESFHEITGIVPLASSWKTQRVIPHRKVRIDRNQITTDHTRSIHLVYGSIGQRPIGGNQSTHRLALVILAETNGKSTGKGIHGRIVVDQNRGELISEPTSVNGFGFHIVKTDTVDTNVVQKLGEQFVVTGITYVKDVALFLTVGFPNKSSIQEESCPVPRSDNHKVMPSEQSQ